MRPVKSNTPLEKARSKHASCIKEIRRRVRGATGKSLKIQLVRQPFHFNFRRLGGITHVHQ